MVENPTGWFVDNGMVGKDVVHEDGAGGRVLVYHPTAPDVALIQGADDDAVQWIGADHVRAV